MKKTRTLIAALALLAVSFAACDDKPVPVEQLPAPARTYVEQQFPGTTILMVKKDREALSTQYDVTLDNGMELSFDSDGMLIDLDN